MRLITKRDILRLDRCTTLFWRHRHADATGATDGAAAWAAAQGREVGIAARAEFEAGIEIGEEGAFEVEELARRTATALASRPPAIFEAWIQAGPIMARPDILVPSGSDSWRLIEVKSGVVQPGSTPDEDLEDYDADLAFQCHVLAEAGVRVERAELMLLSKEYRHGDDASPFVILNRTSEVRAQQPAVRAALARALDIERRGEEPETRPGAHCRRPDSCAFLDHCRQRNGIAPSGTVFEIPRPTAKLWGHLGQGRARLTEIPDHDFGKAGLRYKRSIVEGEVVLDREELADKLSAWGFPLLHLDFEAAHLALPRHPGMKPWQALPFQFSLDVEEGRSTEPRHFEYLHPDESDPRPALAARLADLLEDWPESRIAAWNAGYEKGRLLELAEALPERAVVLRDAAARLVDPLSVVRRNFYDPRFGNSFSIKTVAPVLLGERASYEGLPVAEGNAAALAWTRMIRLKDPHERESIARDLLAYCGKDTRVMLELVREFRRLVGLA